MEKLLELRNAADDAMAELDRIGGTDISNMDKDFVVKAELAYVKQSLRAAAAKRAYQAALEEYAARELEEEQRAKDFFVMPDTDEVPENFFWKPSEDYVEEWEQQERKVQHGLPADVAADYQRRQNEPVPGEYEHKINTSEESRDY